MSKNAKGGPVPCLCNSGLSFPDCCRPLLAGKPAPDALSLMRSRYTAYVLDYEAYLLATWHPRTRPPGLDLDADPVRWLGLDVRHFTVTGPDTAEVEFVARYKRGGNAAERMTERSRFVREDGMWFYLSGERPQAQ